MSISAPASAPRWARSSPKNSTCPLPASSWCSAIPRAFPTRARPSPARPSRSPRCRCARPPRRRGSFCWRARRSGWSCRSRSSAIEDGLIRGRDNRSVSYGELIAGETIRLELADDVPVKAVDAYTIVGQSVPRVDLPAKATGELVYVHDMRVPGMLHGRVVRPPYAGVDAGAFVGTSLIAVDEARCATFRAWSPSSGSATSSASSPSARKTRSRRRRS